MNFNAPIPRAKQPTYHEGSALRSVRDSDSNAKQWQKNKQLAKTLNGMAQAVEQTQKQVNALRRRVVGGGGGNSDAWFWEEGNRKYNPTENSYSINQIVKIRPTDSCVTAGIGMDGGTFKATPGKWVCLQDVPQLAGDGTENPAYIPQLPMPSGDADPDNALNYWEFITPAYACIGNDAPVEI